MGGNETLVLVNMVPLEKKRTQFSYRIEEKKKIMYHYGVSEKNVKGYIEKARKEKGNVGKLFIQKIEMRIDNIIYRLGWAPTLPAARQLVNHGNFYVNEKNVNFPGFHCAPGRNIKNKKFKNYIKKSP